MTLTPSKFDSNSPTYWDSVYEDELKKGVGRIYLGLYKAILGNIKPDAKVLDFGCGIGIFLKWLKKELPNTTLKGMDYSKFAIRVAQADCKENEYVVGDTIAGGPYDVIVCMHVLEHFANPDLYIEQAFNNLAEEGILILIFPMYDHPWHEHIRIWTLDYLRLFMKQQKKWSFVILYRPKTGFVHENGEDGEEAIVFCQKVKSIGKTSSI